MVLRFTITCRVSRGRKQIMKTIEKKEYVNPSMEVVEINAPQIMAGSPPLTEEEYNNEEVI